MRASDQLLIIGAVYIAPHLDAPIGIAMGIVTIIAGLILGFLERKNV